MHKSEVFEGVDETVEDKLLRLIEKGDATVILSAEYIESLNELMKKELITIENEKLTLTEKGRQAQIDGVKIALEKNRSIPKQVKLSDFSGEQLRPGISNRAFLIILFFFLVSVLLTITYINTSAI